MTTGNDLNRLRSDLRSLGENSCVIQRAEVHQDQADAKQKTEIAYAIDKKAFKLA